MPLCHQKLWILRIPNVIELALFEALIKPVDPDDPAVDESSRSGKDAGYGRNPHHADERGQARSQASRPRPDRTIRHRHDFPVNVLCWDNLEAGTALFDRNPDTRFILDHLGILQPRVPSAPAEPSWAKPWADLPNVLDLAKRKNVVIKVSGACTLSKQPYPYPDIWDPRPRVRCLGFRALPVGHRLDA